MTTDKKFSRVCPNCSLNDKVIIKCNACLKYCCVDCSLDLLCIDCYIILNSKNEKNIYIEEKTKDLIMVFAK